MKVEAITLRAGHVVEQDGKLWVVLKSDIYQPGKGASVVQVEMRDVRTGIKMNERYRTQESVERARLDQHDCSYLFSDDDGATFMDQETFDQIFVSKEVMGDKAAYLQDGMKVEMETFEGEPLGIRLPTTVILEIVEADPVVKGQTASSSYKPAVLSNGLKILVPPHVASGTRVVVKTEDNSYVERAKD